MRRGKFILTGAPGAGKTALVRQLERDGFAMVEEAATDVIALEQAKGGQGDGPKQGKSQNCGQGGGGLFFGQGGRGRAGCCEEARQTGHKDDRPEGQVKEEKSHKSQRGNNPMDGPLQRAFRHPQKGLDDDDDDSGWREGSRRGHGGGDGGDDDDDDDDDDCDDDDDDCRGGARNPAPAGTVDPPQNGLFGNGAPPRVRVN